MHLTTKDLIKAQIKERMKAHNAVTHIGNFVVRPPRLYNFKQEQLQAIAPIVNPRLPSDLIKRFYKLNRDTLPQAQRTCKNKPYAFEPSFHVFVYYAYYHVCVVRGDNSIHNVHLYYRDATNRSHWIGSTTIKCEYFMQRDHILKRLTTAITLKKFQVAIHQLESQIPQ